MNSPKTKSSKVIASQAPVSTQPRRRCGRHATATFVARIAATTFASVLPMRIVVKRYCGAESQLVNARAKDGRWEISFLSRGRERDRSAVSEAEKTVEKAKHAAATSACQRISFMNGAPSAAAIHSGAGTCGAGGSARNRYIRADAGCRESTKAAARGAPDGRLRAPAGGPAGR